MRRSALPSLVGSLLVLGIPLVSAAQVPAAGSGIATGTLSAFAAQRVIVAPLQALRADSGIVLAGTDALRREFDDSLGAAIARTGIGKGWSYAPDVVRSAKRNVPYAGDPYALGTQSLGRPTAKPGDALSEVVTGNLRPLLALGDARVAMVPVHVLLERQGPRTRARLRLVLVDGRSAQLLWTRELVADLAVGPDDPNWSNPLTALVAALVAPQ